MLITEILVYGIDSKDKLPINHRHEYNLLAAKIYQCFGQRVKTKFINVTGQELSNIYKRWPLLPVAKLPLVLLNGQMLAYGNIRQEKIMRELYNVLAPRRPFPGLYPSINRG